MKATGIVRRLDDLGRVVFPKEIRRTTRIREGAPLLKTLTQDLMFCIGGGICEKTVHRELKKQIRRLHCVAYGGSFILYNRGCQVFISERRDADRGR